MAFLFGDLTPAPFTTNFLEELRDIIDFAAAIAETVFGKAPPAPSDELRAAHRAAVPPLQALVVLHRDPADYEMLGMAYVASDEPDKGSEMFKKALELERARNPASDLCGNLMRRVSQL